MLGDPPCGCSAVVDYVCGVNQQTYPNSCQLLCAGIHEAHRGPCCQTTSTATCEEGERPALTMGGCADPDGACVAATARCLDDGAPVPEACSTSGESFDTVCAARALAVQASPLWCAP